MGALDIDTALPDAKVREVLLRYRCFEASCALGASAGSREAMA